MTNVHLRLDGTWALCRATRRACPRRFHLPGTSLAEARALPEAFLWRLLEPLDPPQARSADGKEWKDAEGLYHRDHDLPAVIDKDGQLEWYRHGANHRDHDRPAVIEADGGLFWYQRGRLHRDSGPAVIKPDGGEVWYHHGMRIPK